MSSSVTLLPFDSKLTSESAIPLITPLSTPLSTVRRRSCNTSINSSVPRVWFITTFGYTALLPVFLTSFISCSKYLTIYQLFLVYDTCCNCLIIYCCNYFALPVDISIEQAFVLRSAVRFLRSAVANVHSAVVNVRSALRNINQTRCKDTLKQGIMQTSIRLFLYNYHYLTDSISLAIITLLGASARYIIFNFFCHFCHLIN